VHPHPVAGPARPFQPVSLSRGLNHDPVLLFLEATEVLATKVKQVLREYEQGTGQLINPSKCSMMFGSAYTEEDNVKVKEVLNIDRIAQEENTWGSRRRKVE
jgi:hypothetical protein